MRCSSEAPPQTDERLRFARFPFINCPATRGSRARNKRNKNVTVSYTSWVVSTARPLVAAIALSASVTAAAQGPTYRLGTTPSEAEVKTRDADKKPLTFTRAITTARWTFIIGLDGKIIYKNTKADPVKDSQQVATILEKLKNQ